MGLLGALGLGGGGTRQTTETDVITNIITNVVAESVQKCTSSTKASQAIIIRDSSYIAVTGNTMKQSFNISANCEQSQEQLNEIRNAVTAQVQQESTQTTQALLGAVSGLTGTQTDQNVRTAIETSLNNNVLTKVIQSTVDSINMTQRIVVEGSSHAAIQDNKMLSEGELVRNAAQEAVQQTTLIQSMSGDVDQTVDQVIENDVAGMIDSIGNAISGIIDSFAQAWMLWVFIIVCLVIGAIMLFKDQILMIMCMLPPFRFPMHMMRLCDKADERNDGGVVINTDGTPRSEIDLEIMDKMTEMRASGRFGNEEELRAFVKANKGPMNAHKKFLKDMLSQQMSPNMGPPMQQQMPPMQQQRPPMVQYQYPPQAASQYPPQAASQYPPQAASQYPPQNTQAPQNPTQAAPAPQNPTQAAQDPTGASTL